jgi:WD40 repeat protein
MIVGSVLVCTALLSVAVVWQGLRPCAWLDLALQRSGCLALLPGHDANFTEVAAPASGNLLAIASGSEVRIWDMATQQVQAQVILPPRGRPQIVFSPDGQHFAVSERKVVRIRTSQDGLPVQELAGPTRPIAALAWSPDGAWIAAGSFDGSLWLWRVADGTLLWQTAPTEVALELLAFVPHSDRLAAGSARAGVALYHLSDGQMVDTLYPQSVIWDIAFTPDGQYGILALAKTIVVWRVADKAIVRSWQADGNIASLAVSADSQYLATGTDGEMRLAQIWRLADQQLLATHAMQQVSDGKWVDSVSFAGGGTLLAASGARIGERITNSVVVWRFAPSSGE